MWWKELEKTLSKHLNSAPESRKQPRTEKEILEELVSLVREGERSSDLQHLITGFKDLKSSIDRIINPELATLVRRTPQLEMWDVLPDGTCINPPESAEQWKRRDAGVLKLAPDAIYGGRHRTL